jgi:hypothetical protein
VHSWLLSNFGNATVTPAVILDWFRAQDAWMRGQIESNTTAIWRQTAAVVAQFDGLVVGYNAVAAAGEALTPMHFLEASWDVCFVALMPAGLELFALFLRCIPRYKHLPPGLRAPR